MYEISLESSNCVSREQLMMTITTSCEGVTPVQCCPLDMLTLSLLVALLAQHCDAVCQFQNPFYFLDR